MNKLVVAVTLAVLAVGSVAMASMAQAQAPERADDAMVEAQIDARLHALLLKVAAAHP